MRILLASDHRYPANTHRGVGLKSSPNPSGAPQAVHDLLAKGLGELGHTVFYKLGGGQSEAFPQGVFPVPGKLPEVDICHNIPSTQYPWLTTHHGLYGDAGPQPTRHSIFVSRTLARAYGRDRFVWNGIDPQDFVCSFTKEDYFLFLAAMQGPASKDKYRQKGLEVALGLCKKASIRLIVAGTAIDPAAIDLIGRMCGEAGAEYVGDVRGEEKARLLSGARGLLFPTQVTEGFGLAMVEALISGTPVICSDRGACPELIPRDVGFVCSTEDEYLDALERITTISPQRCREVAMERYHYRRMAAGYLVEYRREIAFQDPSQHA
jgi:glycosyltransferase involved in cell wall biosynthesis